MRNSIDINAIDEKKLSGGDHLVLFESSRSMVTFSKADLGLFFQKDDKDHAVIAYFLNFKISNFDLRD